MRDSILPQGQEKTYFLKDEEERLFVLDGFFRDVKEETGLGIRGM